MNARIVNLRTKRKQKARDEKRAKADANAAKHGRTGAEVTRIARSSEIEAHRLDGHRLNDDD